MSAIQTDTPTAAQIPQFGFPFTFAVQPDGTTDAAVNEQDSLDDVFACVQAIVACPLGAWIDNPAFGIPLPTFAQAPVSTIGIRSAVSRWEPRASLALREYPDLLDQAVRNIQVDVSTLQPSQ